MKKSVKALSLILALITLFSMFTVAVSAEETPAECEHEFGEWVVNPIPTCDKAGVKTRVCQKDGCKVFETEVVNPIGHSYSQEGTVVAPTCGSEGYTAYVCAKCSDVKKEDIKPALEHVYGEWNETNPATCTDAGSKERVCSLCDETAVGHIQVETIAALGHKYVETVVAPTYEAGGYTLHKCEVCENEYKDAETDPLPDKIKAVKFAAQDGTGEHTEGVWYVLSYGDKYDVTPVIVTEKGEKLSVNSDWIKSVEFVSSDEGIASIEMVVDDNGNVSYIANGNGTGTLNSVLEERWATVDCTVTDVNGEVYTAKCFIQVDFTIRDWIKIIIDVIRVALDVVVGGIFKGIMKDKV